MSASFFIMTYCVSSPVFVWNPQKLANTIFSSFSCAFESKRFDIWKFAGLSGSRVCTFNQDGKRLINVIMP